MTDLNFVVGTAEQPISAIAGFSQTYEVLAASASDRMGDGSLDTATYWSGKLRTVISGDGWTPPVLLGLNFDSNLTLKCGAPIAVQDATTSVTLPAARRTDAGHTPVGFAIVGGELVATTISSIVSNVATLASVSGASAYVVWYWPELTVQVTERPRQDTATGAAVHRWSLTAEEV